LDARWNLLHNELLTNMVHKHVFQKAITGTNSIIELGEERTV